MWERQAPHPTQGFEVLPEALAILRLEVYVCALLCCVELQLKQAGAVPVGHVQRHTYHPLGNALLYGDRTAKSCISLDDTFPRFCYVHTHSGPHLHNPGGRDTELTHTAG